MTGNGELTRRIPVMLFCRAQKRAVDPLRPQDMGEKKLRVHKWHNLWYPSKRGQFGLE